MIVRSILSKFVCKNDFENDFEIIFKKNDFEIVLQKNDFEIVIFEERFRNRSSKITISKITIYFLFFVSKLSVGISFRHFYFLFFLSYSFNGCMLPRYSDGGQNRIVLLASIDFPICYLLSFKPFTFVKTFGFYV